MHSLESANHLINGDINANDKIDTTRNNSNSVQIDFIEQIKLLLKQQEFMLQLLIQVIL